MYDVIVSGARIAGASTAMLLARRGFRTLLVDRASFPSDTLSSHFLQTSGTALLAQWGLLDQLRDTKCPPVRRNRLDFGPFRVEGYPPAATGGITEFFAPRRSILDTLLVDAAIAAGAEFRSHCVVEDILHTGDSVTGVRARHAGRAFQEEARITIGADGKHSVIARLAGAPEYFQRPALTCAYYAYWTELPSDALDIWIRPRYTLGMTPTHDQQTMAVLMAPIAEFPRIRMDVEKAFMEAMAAIPGLRDRFAAARRTTSFFGTADLPNFYRRPYGPGWALVGDAGYHKDPCTAQGMSDALRDAQLLATALEEGLTGEGSLTGRLQHYESARNDATRAMYDLTCQMASHEPPPPEMASVLAALPGNQAQADRFLGIFAGTVRCEDFFTPQNVAEVLAARSL
jgi:2-polyprenyl-6-methoxyphenol hydroxylase-like FAD-dependent oxidoreductase